MAPHHARPWVPRREGEPSAELKLRFGALRGLLLWARGFDEEDESLGSYLEPRLDTLSSPFSILNMEEACRRLVDTIQNKQRIAIYADYDIDGMSGLAILASFLKSCGVPDLLIRQPDRLTQGYGVHPESLRELKSAGCEVVLTVDTGTSAFEAAAEAKRLGLTMIVTDHHQQVGEIPDGALVLNPNQRGDTSGLGYLSGTGMAFYFSIALRARLREAGYFNVNRKEPDLKDLLDLFVLGTVADLVPLVGDNRALVRAGLLKLQNSRRPGLSILKSRVLEPGTQLTVRDVAFSITPKLNAASRMGRAELSTELLLCDDPLRAQELVDEILRLNDQRSEIQAKIFEEAVEQAESSDSPVLLVHGSWHEGVLGVVAAKLVERFRKPAIVLAHLEHNEGTLRGSMRTLPGYSCIDILTACREHLLTFGGHEMAAGLQVKEENLDALRAALRVAAHREPDNAPSDPVTFDGEMPLTRQAIDDVTALDTLGPWGNGNPDPLFLVSGIDATNVTIMKEKHVKVRAAGTPDIVGFGLAHEVTSITAAGHQKIDALVRPEINRFRGTQTIQWKMAYVRPHQSHRSPAGSGQ